jgi:hypothetical protein
MKALPMLDHVMLWVARAFPFVLLAYIASVIRLTYTDDDTRLIAEYKHQPIFSVGAIIFFAVCLVWDLALIASTWKKPTVVSRTILAISAAFLSYLVVEILAINSPLHTAIALGMPLTIKDFTVPIALILFATSLWRLAVISPFKNRLLDSVNSV